MPNSQKRNIISSHNSKKNKRLRVGGMLSPTPVSESDAAAAIVIAAAASPQYSHNYPTTTINAKYNEINNIETLIDRLKSYREKPYFTEYVAKLQVINSEINFQKVINNLENLFLNKSLTNDDLISKKNLVDALKPVFLKYFFYYQYGTTYLEETTNKSKEEIGAMVADGVLASIFNKVTNKIDYYLKDNSKDKIQKSDIQNGLTLKDYIEKINQDSLIKSGNLTEFYNKYYEAYIDKEIGLLEKGFNNFTEEEYLTLVQMSSLIKFDTFPIRLSIEGTDDESKDKELMKSIYAEICKIARQLNKYPLKTLVILLNKSEDKSNPTEKFLTKLNELYKNDTNLEKDIIFPPSLMKTQSSLRTKNVQLIENKEFCSATSYNIEGIPQIMIPIPGSKKNKEAKTQPMHGGSFVNISFKKNQEIIAMSSLQDRYCPIFDGESAAVLGNFGGSKDFIKNLDQELVLEEGYQTAVREFLEESLIINHDKKVNKPDDPITIGIISSLKQQKIDNNYLKSDDFLNNFLNTIPADCLGKSEISLFGGHYSPCYQFIPLTLPTKHTNFSPFDLNNINFFDKNIELSNIVDYFKELIDTDRSESADLIFLPQFSKETIKYFQNFSQENIELHKEVKNGLNLWNPGINHFGNIKFIKNQSNDSTGIYVELEATHPIYTKKPDFPTKMPIANIGIDRKGNINPDPRNGYLYVTNFVATNFIFKEQDYTHTKLFINQEKYLNSVLPYPYEVSFYDNDFSNKVVYLSTDLEPDDIASIKLLAPKLKQARKIIVVLGQSNYYQIIMDKMFIMIALAERYGFYEKLGFDQLDDTINPGPYIYIGPESNEKNKTKEYPRIIKEKWEELYHSGTQVHQKHQAIINKLSTNNEYFASRKMCQHNQKFNDIIGSANLFILIKPFSEFFCQSISYDMEDFIEDKENEQRKYKLNRLDSNSKYWCDYQFTVPCKLLKTKLGPMFGYASANLNYTLDYFNISILKNENVSQVYVTMMMKCFDQLFTTKIMVERKPDISYWNSNIGKKGNYEVPNSVFGKLASQFNFNKIYGNEELVSNMKNSYDKVVSPLPDEEIIDTTIKLWQQSTLSDLFNNIYDKDFKPNLDTEKNKQLEEIKTHINKDNSENLKLLKNESTPFDQKLQIIKKKFFKESRDTESNYSEDEMLNEQGKELKKVCEGINKFSIMMTIVPCNGQQSPMADFIVPAMLHKPELFTLQKRNKIGDKYTLDNSFNFYTIGIDDKDEKNNPAKIKVLNNIYTSLAEIPQTIEIILPVTAPGPAVLVEPVSPIAKPEKITSRLANSMARLSNFGFRSPIPDLGIRSGLRYLGSRLIPGSNGGKKTQKRNLKLSTSTSRKRNNVRKQTHSRLPHKLKVSHKKVARKYKSIA